MTRKESLNGLIEVSIEKASLTGHIRHAQTKDLLHGCPAVSEPRVEFRTTDEAALFEPTMTFIPAHSFSRLICPTQEGSVYPITSQDMLTVYWKHLS